MLACCRWSKRQLRYVRNLFWEVVFKFLSLELLLCSVYATFTPYKAEQPRRGTELNEKKKKKMKKHIGKLIQKEPK